MSQHGIPDEYTYRRVANNPGGKSDWATDLVKRVGAEVKARRKGRSARWLSDRTAELGYRISPTVIAKLDSGHRGEVLSVAEWLILAAALDIPPLLLLYPDIPDGFVEMLPDVERPCMWAASWVAGDLDEFRSNVVLPEGMQPDRDAQRVMESIPRKWVPPASPAGTVSIAVVELHDKPFPLRRPTPDKVRHPTRRHAELAMLQFWSTAPAWKAMQPIRVYECDCGMWHTTSSPGYTAPEDANG